MEQATRDSDLTEADAPLAGAEGHEAWSEGWDLAPEQAVADALKWEDEAGPPGAELSLTPPVTV